jgi:hypothetical protein
MRQDFLADEGFAPAVLQLVGAVVLRQPFVQPDGNVPARVRDDEMRIFVEDHAQAVGRRRGVDGDVVHVGPPEEQPAQLDWLPVESWLEGREGAIGREDQDDCGGRGARYPVGQHPAERFAERFELDGDVPKRRHARIADHDEVGAVHAVPVSRTRSRGDCQQDK